MLIEILSESFSLVIFYHIFLRMIKTSSYSFLFLITAKVILLESCTPPPPSIYSPDPIYTASFNNANETEIDFKGIYVPDDLGINFQFLRSIKNNIFICSQFLYIEKRQYKNIDYGSSKRKYFDIGTGYYFPLNSIIKLNFMTGIGFGEIKNSYTIFNKSKMRNYSIKEIINGIYITPFLQNAVSLYYSIAEFGVAWKLSYFNFNQVVLQENKKYLTDVFNEIVYHWDIKEKDIRYEMQLIESYPVRNTFDGIFYERFSLNLGISFLLH